VGIALAGTGGLLGAGLSAGLAAAGGMAMRAAGVAVPGGTILMSAGVGAALGALLTPLTALSLLRQIALGRALLFTMLGMSAGVAAGELARGETLVSTAAGVGGFLLVALLLRVTSRPRAPKKDKSGG
jgi:hypothetical protein